MQYYYLNTHVLVSWFWWNISISISRCLFSELIEIKSLWRLREKIIFKRVQGTGGKFQEYPNRIFMNPCSRYYIAYLFYVFHVYYHTHYSYLPCVLKRQSGHTKYFELWSVVFFSSNPSHKIYSIYFHAFSSYNTIKRKHWLILTQYMTVTTCRYLRPD